MRAGPDGPLVAAGRGGPRHRGHHRRQGPGRAGRARPPDLAARWSRKLGPVFSSPASAGPLTVVGADDGAVHALDTATGAPRWSQKIGTKVRATPAVAGETVYAAALDGTTVALAAARRAPGAGSARSATPCTRRPAWPRASLVFGCHEGHVHGLDAATGAPRFETATRGPVLASPAAHRRRTLVASTDGAPVPPRRGGRRRAAARPARRRHAVVGRPRRRRRLRRRRRRRARPRGARMIPDLRVPAWLARACSTAITPGPATCSSSTATCATCTPSAPATSGSRRACGGWPRRGRWSSPTT